MIKTVLVLDLVDTINQFKMIMEHIYLAKALRQVNQTHSCEDKYG